MIIPSPIRGALRPRINTNAYRFLGIVLLLVLGSPLATAADVELTWDVNPAEEAVSGYRLHYGITSGHYEYTSDVGSKNSAILENLGGNIHYYVALSAYTGEGLESELSEEFEFITPAAPEESDPETGGGADTESDAGHEGSTASDPNGSESAGGSNTGDGLSSGKVDVDLAWDPNPAADGQVGYRLYYGTTSGSYPAVLDTGTSTSATMTGLAGKTVYYVVLSAYNEEGIESEFSEEFKFLAPEASADTGGDGIAENDPGTYVGTGTPDHTGQDGEAESPTTGSDGGDSENNTEVEGELPGGNATADLIWDANPATDGVIGYRLYYGITSGSYPAMIDTGASTSVTVTGLAEDTTYFVVLTAYNDEGLESPPSEEFQFVSSSNLPPEIVLTRIGGEDISSQDGTMILLATARDEDGFVSRVDFYDGTRLLHSDENFPYALRVSGLAPGLHQLRAIAVDDFGEATESAALSVQVGSAIAAPLPETPKLTLTQSSVGKSPLFTVTASPGSRVHLEASSNLNDWDVVSEGLADDSGNVEITDPTPESELPSQRFYRVVTL